MSDPFDVFKPQTSSSDGGRGISIPSTFGILPFSPMSNIGIPSARSRSSSCIPPSDSDSDSVSEMMCTGWLDILKRVR